MAIAYQTPLLLFVQSETKDYDESHDFFHAQAVFENAMNILKETPVNLPIDVEKIVTMAAYLHDVCDHKYKASHTKYFRMESFIGQYCTPSEKMIINGIIKNVSFSKEKKGQLEDMGEYQILRNIVSDADKLEALGEVGLRRCIAYTRTLKPEHQVREHVIQHCHDKLLHLKDDYIRTDAGKRMAEPLHQVIVDYVMSHESQPMMEETYWIIL